MFTELQSTLVLALAIFGSFMEYGFYGFFLFVMGSNFLFVRRLRERHPALWHELGCPGPFRNRGLKELTDEQLAEIGDSVLQKLAWSNDRFGKAIASYILLNISVFTVIWLAIAIAGIRT